MGDVRLEQPKILRGYAPSRFGQVHFRESGPDAAPRPPLICLHHVPNSGQIFEPVLPLLAADRRVYALDLPGFGMSDPSPDPQSIDDYALAIADAIVALGHARTDVDLLGYHTGAAVASQLALDQRLMIRRIVLAAIPVLTESERAAFGAQTPIAFDEAGDWAREEWRRSWTWRGPGQSQHSVLRTFAEKMRPGARERGAHAIMRYDMATALQQLTPPLMILRPRDDLWDATDRAMKLRPDARSVELPDLGHGMWEAAPERTARLIDDFLR